MIYQNAGTRESPIDIPTSPIIAYVIQMVCLAVDTRESLFEIYPDENTRESPIDIQIHQPHVYFQWIHRNHLWELPIDVQYDVHMAAMILLWALGQTQLAKYLETPHWCYVPQSPSKQSCCNQPSQWQGTSNMDQ